MADVFISYKREDRARAAAIVAALRESGKTVWWDEGLTPRQAWDATIEHEIGAAANVVVLWSSRSVASDWVRTEAHYAQDRRKLVPVLIEPCTIPLAFMLRQAVDLSAWRGATSDPVWLKLLDWLDHAHHREEARPAPPPPRQPRSGLARSRALLAALLVPIALVAGWFALRPRPAQATASSVSVAPFTAPRGDAAAATFSQGFAADLAQLVTSGGSKLNVIDGASAGAAAARPDFTLNGTVRSDAGKLHATLTLNSASDGAIIWSTDLERPIAQAASMHLEAEVRMGSVFICALADQARDRAVVSLDALKVYLQSCESLPSEDNLATRKLLSDVTALAPNFAQGWASLAEWNGFVANGGDSNADAAHREALAAATRALTLDPRSSGAWVARAMVKSKLSDWSAAMADLDKALSLDRDDPIGNFFYAANLREVGRTAEALDYAKRAANSGPRFWPKTMQVIMTLADLGQTDEAQAMAATALKTWPDTLEIQNLVQVLAVRYANPAKAEAVLADPAVVAATKPARLAFLRLEAKARATRSPQLVADAAAQIANLYHGPDNVEGAVLNSLVIGRPDDAYATIAALPDRFFADGFAQNPELYFTPYAVSFRADPRFMPLARKQGLVAIWQATNKWPDFCTAATAPYDCKAVATADRGKLGNK